MQPSFVAFVLAVGLATPIAASPIHQTALGAAGISLGTNSGMPGFFRDFSSGWGPYRCPPDCVMSNAAMYDPLPTDLDPRADILGSTSEFPNEGIALIPAGSSSSPVPGAPDDRPEPIPEPATLSLFATGFAAIAMRRRLR